jgi:hypothetical protein
MGDRQRARRGHFGGKHRVHRRHRHGSGSVPAAGGTTGRSLSQIVDHHGPAQDQPALIKIETTGKLATVSEHVHLGRPK